MTVMFPPSEATRKTLRNAGWNTHLRVLRGTFEVSRPGERFDFDLRDEFEARALGEFVASITADKAGGAQ